MGVPTYSGRERLNKTLNLPKVITQALKHSSNIRVLMNVNSNSVYATITIGPKREFYLSK